MNIYSWLEIHSKERPAKVCIKTHDREITYGELSRAARSLGIALKQAGLRKDDKVILVLPNIPEFVISYMAIIGLGATVVPVNPSYTAWELAHIIGNSDSKVIILEKGRLETYRKILEQCPLDIVITTGEEGDFNQWITGRSQEIGEDCTPDDVAVIMYSSGLTGYPMGVMLTQGNLDHNSDLLRLCMDCDETDTTLTVIPLFHSFSASVNMLSMLRLGGTIYLMNRLNFKEMDYALKEAGITAICAVPTLFFGLIHHPEVQNVDCSGVRTLIAGGSALSREIFDAFKEKFHQEIHQGYGITEASPVCSVHRKHQLVKPESIGPTVPGVEVMVVDDNGHPLKTNKTGELLFKGPNIMKGYYKYEKETTEIIRDGWLYTGDLGFVDEDGYITITGYKKEMVITSGFNVYSREVEGVLNAVSGVRDSAITGVPDLMRGAIIKAYIVRENTGVSEQEIKHQAHERLASYKTPRMIVFVEEIPRDAQGRILRSQLS
ncbi:MAG: AMP-binding protein [Thermodesulfobacteriota bacterium]|jgi:long-chain acyl-CoA synthetase